jgi:hypothetical protein
MPHRGPFESSCPSQHCFQAMTGYPHFIALSGFRGEVLIDLQREGTYEFVNQDKLE